MSRSLVTVIALTFIQTIIAPLHIPSLAPVAQASSLYDNRTNFLQWDNWRNSANHVPWWNESYSEISANGDGIQFTQNQNSQYGALWNTAPISLANDFAISATYYFGAVNTDAGADGIMFLLQPLSQWPNGGTSGSSSGGASFWQNNQLRVYFDTYENSPDLPNDHVMVQAVNSSGTAYTYSKTGNYNGVALYNASGTELTNVENNGYYPFTIQWKASTRSLSIYGGANSDRVFHTVTIPANEFDGTNLYWGWQGSTGGANNYQSISSVNYHIGPTINSATTGNVVAVDGNQVTLNSNYTAREGVVTARWEYSTNGGTSWTSTNNSSTSYSFTAARSLSNRQYRYYVETNALGAQLTAASTPLSLSVVGQGGETDTALTLNGTSQYAELSDPGTSPFDSSGTFTLSAWVKPNGGCATNGTIISKRAYMMYCSGGYWFYMVLSDGANGAGVTTGIPVEADEWHYLTFTKSSSSGNLLVYYDGVLARTIATGVTTIAGSNYPFQIGRYGTGMYFNGQIDEVRMYNTQRSESQIQSDMHSSSAVADSDLVAYFDCNEGSGTTLYSRKTGATGNTDLVISGSPSFTDVKITDTTSIPGYTIVKFPRSYITTAGGWKVPQDASTVSMLVIGGGGGGGSRVGGGGGAGGYVFQSGLALTTGAVETITVGQGGFGGRFTADTKQFQAYSGQDSKFGSQTVKGGGGGGGYDTSGGNNHEGLNGGSGGGAASAFTGYGTSATIGLGQQFSTYGYGSGNNGGSAYGGYAGYYPAGGGGGAGGVGGSASGTSNSGVSGAGGAGIVDPIGGTNTCFAAGGGGGAGNSMSSAGAAGSCGAGTTTTATAGTVGQNDAASAAPFSGSGGGGSGYYTGSASDKKGGNGGSGVVIVKYLSASKPTFVQPVNDTTTAGLTYTWSTSGTPFEGFTRNYKWQYSIDTGTSWSFINTGTGFNSETYTTTILETTTSGSQYQYRVIVTDTTSVTTLSETSTGVWLIINPRIAMTGTFTSMKYGTTHTDTFTVTSGTGTGTKVIKRTSTQKTNITWDTSTANIARVTVGAGLLAGSYYDTLTITDQESATTLFAVTITVLKADTATLVVTSRNDTYTASSLTYVDTFTASGLVSTDSFTAVSYSFSGTANDGTVFTQSARPAIAGIYTIIPTYTLTNASSYESITVTTGTLTINRATRTSSISSRPTTLAYGDTSTIVASTSAGASDGSFIYATSTPSFCAFTGSQLQAVDSSGTCSYTATMSRGNNYETSTATAYTTTLSQAESLTVSVQSIAPLTYTASQAAVSPKISINGLKLTDTATATSATFNYAQGTTNLSFSTTRPTNSDTYTVRASGLTLTSGTLSKYKGVIYVDTTLRINRAQQANLYLAQYAANFGTPYRLVVIGGSGTGNITETVTAGTASGCTLNIDTITTTTQGSCLVTAVKAQDQNYETATVTAYVYLLVWAQAPTATVGSGSSITLNSETSITRDANVAPTISGLSTTSASVGSTITLTGAGFYFADSSKLVIKFWRNVIADRLTYSNYSDTSVTVAIPAGATTGRIVVVTPNGVATSVSTLAIS